MQPIVQVTGLTKQFKNLTAVDGLSFSVNEGDVYGFLGQNGAGKSTSIRMMLTLIEPTSGEIEIFGMKLAKHRREILSQIGAVIEKPDIYKYLSAYDNLKLFAKLSGINPSSQQLMDQLEMVGLAHRANDKVKTFSQGMKQRLGIGIALVHNPRLIILDEPTNGLDPVGIAEIRELIKELSKQGKTIIMASHLLDEVEKVCTHVAILKKGELLTSGSIRDLMSGEEIIHLDATDLTHLQQILQGYPGIASMKIEGEMLKVHAIGGEIQLEEINRYCFQQGIALRQLTLHKKSLETTFLELTH